MGGFSWLRAGGLTLAAFSVVSLLTTSVAAEAGPLPQHAAAGACVSKLRGYQPAAESAYVAKAGSNYFYLDQVREGRNGDISGTALYYVTSPIHFYTGSFTGRISSGTIRVRGGANTAGWDFSFTGTITCLMSQIKTTNVATSPSGKLPSTLQLTTVCELGPPFGIGVATSLLPACAARQILDGIRQPLWDNGGPIPGDGSIPYSWGGGHPPQARKPGPSLGTCVGYTGPLPKGKTCRTWNQGPTHTVGLDCSGFTRWIFYMLTGGDTLGGGGTGAQVQSSHFKNGADVPGDLVYFYTYNKKKQKTWDHVGIIIAPGEMIDEPKTGADLRVDKIVTGRRGYGTAVYKAYKFPPVG